MPFDSLAIGECYLNIAKSLNYSGKLDSSLAYLDSVSIFKPALVRKMDKAEFFYRCGEIEFRNKNLEKAKYSFIQCATYIRNNKIVDTLEASAWLYLGGIFAGQLKIQESLVYFDSACSGFIKYYGKENYRTREVCKMANSIRNLGKNPTDLRDMLDNIPLDDLILAIEKILDTTSNAGFRDIYANSMFKKVKKDPEFPILLKALLSIMSHKPDQAIGYIQKYYTYIIVGFKDSLDYEKDPNTFSLTEKTNLLLTAYSIKSMALVQLALDEQNVNRLIYANSLMRRCDTLVNLIKIGTKRDDINSWGNFITGIYFQWIDIAGDLFEITRKDKYFEFVFYATERLKANSLVSIINEEKSTQEIPSKILNEKMVLESTVLRLNREVINSSVLGLSQKTIKVKSDSLFNAEANLKAVLSNIEINYKPYWLLHNEKSIVTSSELRKTIDPGVAIISYTLTNDETISKIITTRDNINVTLLEKIPELKKWVNDVVGFVNSDSISMADYQKSAHNLFNVLLGDIPDGISRIVLIPDGYLLYLPFESLLLSKPKSNSLTELPYLIKKYVVGYAYSATSYVESHTNKTPKIHDRFLTGFGSSKTNEFRYIKSFCDSLGYAYKIFEKKSDATKSNFIKEVNVSTRFLHVGGHGFESSGKMEKIAIALESRDEIYYDDVLRGKYDVDLVLLLTCLSANGEFVKGEGIIGLNRAFYSVGVRNILLTRGIVNVEPNTKFIEFFYKQYVFNQSIKYSEALRNAMIGMIQIDEWSHPKYWAGYYLIGE